MSGLDIQLKKKQEIIDELEEKLKECEVEIIGLEADKEKDQQIIADLRKQLGEKKKPDGNALELKKKQETIDELEEKLKGCEVDILALEDQQQKDQKTIADLKKQLADKSKPVKCENCAKKDSQIAELNQKLKTSETKIASLEADKKKDQATIADLKKQLGDKDKTIDDLKKQVESNNKTVEDQKRQLDDNSKQIAELKHLIAEYQENDKKTIECMECKKKQNVINQQDSKMKQFETDVLQLQTSDKKAKDQIYELEEKLRGCEAEIQMMEVDKQRDTQLIKDRDKDIEQKDKEIQKLKKQNNDDQAQIQEKEKQNQLKDAALKDKEKDNQGLEAKLKDKDKVIDELRKKMNENESKMPDIDQKNKEIDELRKKFEAEQAKNADLEKENQKKDSNLKEKEKENQILNDQLKENQKLIDDLKQQLAQAQSQKPDSELIDKELDELKKQLEAEKEKNSEYEKENQQYDKILKEKDREIYLLDSALTENKIENRIKDEALREKDETLIEKRKLLNQLKNKIDEMEEEKEKEKNKDKDQNEIEAQKQKDQEKDDKIDNLQNDNAKLLKRIAELEKLLAEAQKPLEQALAQCQGFLNDNEELQKKINALEKKIQDDQQPHDIANAQNQSLLKDNDELNKRIAELEKQLAEAVKDKELLIPQIKELQKENEDLKNRIADLEKQLAEALNQKEQELLQKQVQQNEAANAELQKRIDQLEKQLAEEQKPKEKEIEQKPKNDDSATAELQKRIDDLEKQLAEAQKQKEKELLQKQIQQNEDANAALQKKIADLEKQLADLQQPKEPKEPGLIQKLFQYQQADPNAELKKRIADLEKQLADAQKPKDQGTLQRQVQQNQADNEQLQKRIADLEKQLAEALKQKEPQQQQQITQKQIPQTSESPNPELLKRIADLEKRLRDLQDAKDKEKQRLNDVIKDKDKKLAAAEDAAKGKKKQLMRAVDNDDPNDDDDSFLDHTKYIYLLAAASRYCDEDRLLVRRALALIKNRLPDEDEDFIKQLCRKSIFYDLSDLIIIRDTRKEEEEQRQQKSGNYLLSPEQVNAQSIRNRTLSKQSIPTPLSPPPPSIGQKSTTKLIAPTQKLFINQFSQEGILQSFGSIRAKRGITLSGIDERHLQADDEQEYLVNESCVVIGFLAEGTSGTAVDIVLKTPLIQRLCKVLTVQPYRGIEKINQLQTNALVWVIRRAAPGTKKMFTEYMYVMKVCAGLIQQYIDLYNSVKQQSQYTKSLSQLPQLQRDGIPQVTEVVSDPSEQQSAGGGLSIAIPDGGSSSQTSQAPSASSGAFPFSPNAYSYQPNPFSLSSSQSTTALTYLTQQEDVVLSVPQLLALHHAVIIINNVVGWTLYLIDPNKPHPFREDFEREGYTKTLMALFNLPIKPELFRPIIAMCIGRLHQGVALPQEYHPIIPVLKNQAISTETWESKADCQVFCSLSACADNHDLIVAENWLKGFDDMMRHSYNQQSFLLILWCLVLLMEKGSTQTHNQVIDAFKNERGLSRLQELADGVILHDEDTTPREQELQQNTDFEKLKELRSSKPKIMPLITTVTLSSDTVKKIETHAAKLIQLLNQFENLKRALVIVYRVPVSMDQPILFVTSFVTATDAASNNDLDQFDSFAPLSFDDDQSSEIHASSDEEIFNEGQQPHFRRQDELENDYDIYSITPGEYVEVPGTKNKTNDKELASRQLWSEKQNRKAAVRLIEARIHQKAKNYDVLDPDLDEDHIRALRQKSRQDLTLFIFAEPPKMVEDE
ncbi:MAG: hypothetical protein EZS28_002544 [Streblomastix strix]|uniref:Uncharacterized protein n=1 Tax=Streblomastix strix TaxID=222440 RepID=A0A5J4X5X0_9EUKA|nr:MAG: hypothetical protein EZS28_002544 [Streblomastix strix]